MKRQMVCSTLSWCALTFSLPALAQGPTAPETAPVAPETAPGATPESDATAPTEEKAPDEGAQAAPAEQPINPAEPAAAPRAMAEEPPLSPVQPEPDAEMLAPPTPGGSPEFDNLDLGELLNMRLENTYVVSRKMENVDGAPAVVTVIGAEELRRAGVRTISEALQRVPGFYPSRQFFHDDLIGVRGYFFHTNDKIVLLMDGHNISRSGWTSVMTGDLDEVNSLEKVERIEIIHGPGSIVWGDNALFTAINIVTKQPRNAEGLTGTLRYGRYLQEGNTNSYVANLQYGKQYSDDVGILINFNLPVIQGWRSSEYGAWFQGSPRGTYTLDNFDSEFMSYEFYAKAVVHDWRVWFRAMNPHQKGAMTQNPAESPNVTWRPYRNNENFSLQNYNMVIERDFHPSDDLKFQYKAGFDKYLFNGAFSFGPGQFSCDQAMPDACVPGPNNLGPTFYMTQDNNALSTSFTGSYTGLAGHTMLAGMDFVFAQYGDSRAVPVFPDDSIRSPAGAEYTSAVWVPGSDVTLGGYLQEQWRIIDHLELFAGARGEWNTPRSDGDFVISPRGGVIGRPLGDDYLLMKYSYNTGFRRPNWWQARWPLGLFGNYFDFVADKPEYSQNHDLQAIWNPTDRIKLNAVYWFLRADDMIFSANTASGGTPNWVNAGNFLSDGLELKFDWNFMDRNLAGFNATWTRKATFEKTVPEFNEESFVNAEGRFLDYPEFQANVFTNWLFSNGMFADLTARYMTKIPGREPIGETADLATINAQNREVTVKNIYYLDVAVGAKDLIHDGLQLTLRGLNVLNNRKRIPRGQGDHDLYEPAPTYLEAQLAYTY